MKVKAVYRDLKDEGRVDFMARVVEFDVSEEVTLEELEKVVKEAVPPGFKFDSLGLP